MNVMMMMMMMVMVMVMMVTVMMVMVMMMMMTTRTRYGPLPLRSAVASPLMEVTHTITTSCHHRTMIIMGCTSICGSGCAPVREPHLLGSTSVDCRINVWDLYGSAPARWHKYSIALLSPAVIPRPVA